MKIHNADPAAAFQFQWSVIETTNSIPFSASQDTHGLNPGSHQSLAGQVKSTRPQAQRPPCNRYHHAACCVGNHVYIYGGKDRYSPLKDLWRLDVVTGQWESLAPWGVDLPHLQGHTMTAYRSQVLIFGGSFSESVIEETPLWILSTDLHCLRQYHPDSPSCARPTGRREHSCVVYQNSIYIYGGFSDSGGSTDEFWSFNIEEEVWRLIRQRKPGKRHGHVAVVMGGHMWLHGGMKRLKPLSDLWTYNFSMCSWNAIKSQGVSPVLTNHTAHVVKNYLLLFGGLCQGKPLNSIWLFQFDTGSWRQITETQSEWCSPVSLHCSVALGRALQEATACSSDRTHSVPQLRKQEKLKQQGQLTDRPWTSPCQDSGIVTSILPFASVKKSADVLQLESLQHNPQTMFIDKNNNASEEDLTNDAETSFFDQKDLPYLQNKKSSNKLWWGKNEEFPKESNRSDSTSKIRPASEELCCDKFPLLQSFQSVNSISTFEKTNLTLTLSDEQVGTQSFPENDKNTVVVSSQDQKLQNIMLPNSGQSTRAGKSVFKTRGCDFINPLYNAVHESSCTDTVICSPTARKSVFYPFKDSRRSASLSHIYEAENIPPKNSDMVLEDLESCDITNLFHNIDVASPSVLSASLSQLSSHGDNKQSSSSVLKQTQNISCTDLRNPFPKSLTVRENSLSNVCSENVASKNSREAMEVSKGAFQGRYSKNSALSNKSKLSTNSKHRYKYFSSSELDSLVATTSIATQTRDSQFSLHSNQSGLTGFHVVSSDQFQPDTVTSGGYEGSHQVHSGSIAHTRVPNSTSIADCQVCFLVIGGQTGSPSFTTEPLKMWRCLLL
ncbi:Tip elongation aberrant protein 1 [Elysia marginata]|uniref:Rab9 effector protein with kelch motifs n=1 Tax=Elysia marginata TaxID=1093978 RepID=A0AAV4I1Q5_9GAST|nr:Tip elongation aberrant protein 1 [Elysia marginata]